MLESVQIRTPQGSLLTLPLEDVSDGLVLEDILGLDPVKATLVSSSFAQQDGAQYHSSRRETRNLVLKFGFEADIANTTIRALRQRLYEYLMPKSEVDLRFIDSDGSVVRIDGRVETCETDLFSQEPRVNSSILCFDPDFRELTPETITGTTVNTSTETLVMYEGTVETGIEFQLNVNRALSAFTIYHRPPDGTLRSLDFAASLISGDVLNISTVPGAKSLTLTRAATTSSILYGMSPQSSWIELAPGDNYLRVYATGAAVPFEIEYTNRYGGL